MRAPKTELAVLIVAAFIVTAAAAATPEETYWAARDAAIAKVKAATAAEPKNPTGSDDDKVIALDNRELAGLEKQLRAIVGAVAIKGLDGKGAINLDTLSDGDEDFGLLDGMVSGLDAKTWRDRDDRRFVPALAATTPEMDGQRTAAGCARSDQGSGLL